MARAGTDRLKVNPPLGLRPSLENCRIADLRVDPAYQRSTEVGTSISLIRRIAMFWDWALFLPLSVARREDGSLWVVDGQHRLAAARLRRDIYDLPCVVTRYAGVADEAASFVALNMHRRPLGATDMFKAALASGDSEAGEVAGLIAAAGLSLAPHSNWTAWKPGMVWNIAGIRECHKRHGRDITLCSLRALARGFEGQVLRYGGTLFGAIFYFLAEVAKQDDFELDWFVELLRGATQQEWVGEIGAVKGREGIRQQIAGRQVLRQAYDEMLAIDEAEAA